VGKEGTDMLKGGQELGDNENIESENLAVKDLCVHFWSH
jgi:hypothetical protein